MAHAYLAVQRRTHHGTNELLLAQKNIYLPPHRRYQFAAIARNAVQYVIPGGRIEPGENPAHAAVREFHEDTGVRIAPEHAHLFFQVDQEHWFYQVKHTHSIDVGAINAALRDGTTDSLKFNSMAWMPIEEAQCRFGNKNEYQVLPWVTNQILRALNAGFSKDLVNRRANESHIIYTIAVARLILAVYGLDRTPADGAAGDDTSRDRP